MARIKQSFAWWCYENRGVEAAELIRGAAKIGYQGVDLVGEEFWPAIVDAGMEIVAINGHGTLSEGLNRRDQHARIEKKIKTNIEKAVKWKIPVLICFTGNRGAEDDEAGLRVTTEALRRLVPLAEQAGVKLGLELLNSKIDHIGYQADHTAWGLRLCRMVESPAFGLLYDIYHMQIMEGDLMRAIKDGHPDFVHYHTAGNPGRGPINANQEIQYAPIYRLIEATGYQGFIAHEFYPEGDPVANLQEAFEQCTRA